MDNPFRWERLELRPQTKGISSFYQFIISSLVMQKDVYEFVSKQMSDPIVERKTCAVSGTPFAIFQSDVDFYEKISPSFDGKKFPMPTPALCPEERERRRYARRNEWHLYRRKCDKTGKSIMAMYPEDC